MFKNLKTTATINVLASNRSLDHKTKQELSTKEGKPLYELAVTSEEKKTIAGQEFVSSTIAKLKSEINLDKGEHIVELIEFAMSSKDSQKVEKFYRVVGVVSSTNIQKKVA